MIKESKMLEAHHWIAARYKNPNKSTKYSKKECKMLKKRKKKTYFEDSDSISFPTLNFNMGWKIDI